jgi:hypothetical protein
MKQYRKLYHNNREMASLISIFLFLIFLFLSLIHIWWGFGGEWGKDAAIPTKNHNIKIMSPGSLPTFIIALGLLALGAFILVKAKFLNISIPPFFDKYGLWIIAIIFLLRTIGEFKYVGFFKKIKQTKFAKNDTKYYSPLCLTIVILTIILELNK